MTLRAGRFWDDYKTTGIPGESSIQYTNSSENLPFAIPAALQQPALYTTTPRVQNTYFDVTARTFFQIDASKFMTFFGQHNLKGGYGRSKTVNKVRELYPGGGTFRSIGTRATPARTSVPVAVLTATTRCR